MRIFYFIILCLMFFNLGCSHFKMETPRESEQNPTTPEVYDEDVKR